MNYKFDVNLSRSSMNTLVDFLYYAHDFLEAWDVEKSLKDDLVESLKVLFQSADTSFSRKERKERKLAGKAVIVSDTCALSGSAINQ